MIRNIFRKNKGFSSAVYWETRYKQSGNSGAGSYDQLATFKAEVINQAIIDYKINTVVSLAVVMVTSWLCIVFKNIRGWMFPRRF